MSVTRAGQQYLFDILYVSTAAWHGVDDSFIAKRRDGSPYGRSSNTGHVHDVFLTGHQPIVRQLATLDAALDPLGNLAVR